MLIDHILIRYGELALKGKNRSFFEDRLLTNVRQALHNFPQIKAKKIYGRIKIALNGAPYPQVAAQLRHVFGIISFSPVRVVPLELGAIQNAALEMIKELSPFPRTFKVQANRANKQFPYSSPELNHLVGSHILRNTENLKVDVHQPEATVKVDVRTEGAFISCLDVPGIGGLPIGVSGKAMLMLSGGIDSPVAGWMTMKRGVIIEGVHFHSYPFTSERAKQKVIDLTKILSRYGGKIKLHIVPFTEIQTQIRQHCPEHYGITIMRRMMMRITAQLAAKSNALAIATGESLGQVASQTMESMHTINRVVDIPVIRPLIAMDKTEIMNVAKKIETYDISILPYEDCCTVFVPQSPVTRPTPEQAEKFERALDVAALVQDAVARTEWLWITADNAQDEENSFF